MKLCECGCGAPARPGKRFARYHQVGVNGRALVWVPNEKRYEYRYRIVMAAHLGRPLAEGECVHHRNGNILDDRIENLVLCASNAEHRSRHHCRYRGTFTCETCGKECRGETRRKWHFCSRACLRKWKGPGRPIISGVGAWTEITCANCGKKKKRKGGHKGHDFCSHQCYWAWQAGKVKLPNRRTIWIEYNGERRTVAEWSRILGVSDKTIYARLNRGVPAADVFKKPFRKSPKKPPG